MMPAALRRVLPVGALRPVRSAVQASLLQFNHSSHTASQVGPAAHFPVANGGEVLLQEG